MAVHAGQNALRKPEPTPARPRLPDTKTRQVVCVVGSAGGDGSTTIAANLAMSLQAGEERRSVVLMDLDLQGGDIRPFFGIETPHSLREIPEDPGRMDEAYLMNLLVRHPSGLHLLPSGYDGWMSGAPQLACLQRVADLAQALFDVVIVDCGHTIDAATSVLIDRSTSIIAVSSLQLRSVRRARGLLVWLRTHGVPSGRTKLVVNRYKPSQATLLTEAESLLGYRATAVVPDDTALAEDALIEGAPIVTLAPNSEIGRQILVLAGLCATRPTSESKAVRAAEILRAAHRRWFARVR